MSDLDLPDLSLAVAERTNPPRFEAVLARARRQRRRQYAVAGVAAAIVVGSGVGVAGLFDSTSTPSPAPSAPSSSESGADEAARLIADAEAAPVATSVSADGNVAVIWQSASFIGRAFALRVNDGPDLVGMMPGQAYELVPVPDGWLAMGGPQPVLFLALEGTLSAVPTTDQVATPRVGDRVVVRPDEILLYSTNEHRLLELPPLPDDLYALAADITGLGRVVAACSTRGTADESVGRCVLDGDSWTYTPQAEGKSAYPGVVASYGEHVAVTTIRGKSNYLLDSLTLLDGDHASDVDVATLELGRISSMAVLDDGSVVMSDDDGRLTGVTPDGDVRPIDSGRFVRLTSTGERVWATGLDDPRVLYSSDDHGESWQETLMPGLP